MQTANAVTVVTIHIRSRYANHREKKNNIAIDSSTVALNAAHEATRLACVA